MCATAATCGCRTCAGRRRAASSSHSPRWHGHPRLNSANPARTPPHPGGSAPPGWDGSAGRRASRTPLLCPRRRAVDKQRAADMSERKDGWIYGCREGGPPAARLNCRTL
eukprot:scaffold781_cov394-Prasinococcus_capsulatus_cf.AAC.16